MGIQALENGFNSALNNHYSEKELAERKAEFIDELSDEIVKDILSVDGFKFNGAIYGASDVTKSIYSDEKDSESMDNILRMIASSPIIWMKPCTEDIKTLMHKHAKKIAVELAELEYEQL